jgi:hypothetical protein
MKGFLQCWRHAWMVWPARLQHVKWVLHVWCLFVWYCDVYWIFFWKQCSQQVFMWKILVANIVCVCLFVSVCLHVSSIVMQCACMCYLLNLIWLSLPVSKHRQRHVCPLDDYVHVCVCLFWYVCIGALHFIHLLHWFNVVLSHLCALLFSHHTLWFALCVYLFHSFSLFHKVSACITRSRVPHAPNPTEEGRLANHELLKDCQDQLEDAGLGKWCTDVCVPIWLHVHNAMVQEGRDLYQEGPHGAYRCHSEALETSDQELRRRKTCTFPGTCTSPSRQGPGSHHAEPKFKTMEHRLAHAVLATQPNWLDACRHPKDTGRRSASVSGTQDTRINHRQPKSNGW